MRNPETSFEAHDPRQKEERLKGKFEGTEAAPIARVLGLKNIEAVRGEQENENM